MVLPMQRRRQPNPFDAELAGLLQSHNLSAAAFCRRTGLRPTRLSNLRLRQPSRAPQREEVQGWAAAAGFTAQDGERLWWALQLAHAPAKVCERLAYLEATVPGTPTRVASGRTRYTKKPT